MGIFLVEVVVSSIAINGYLFSFFFWLDILSTITMIMDVNLFTDVVFSSYLFTYVELLQARRPARFLN
jgi:hypothetical protein